MNICIPCSCKEYVSLALLFEIFISLRLINSVSVCLRYWFVTLFSRFRLLATAATFVLLEFIFIDNYSCWEDHDDKQVVGWDNDGRIYSKGLNGHHWTKCVWHECYSCSAWSHSNGSDRSFPCIWHPLLPVTFVDINAGALSPCVNEHKDIISSNS